MYASNDPDRHKTSASATTKCRRRCMLLKHQKTKKNLCFLLFPVSLIVWTSWSTISMIQTGRSQNEKNAMMTMTIPKPTTTTTGDHDNGIEGGSVPLVDEQTSISYGKFGDESFRLTCKDCDSWWHDVPIRPTMNNDFDASVIVNMVTEIPLGTTAKMEVDKSIKYNPIKHDMNKDGTIRYYTYGKTFFNYGFIPQTWEDPTITMTVDNMERRDGDQYVETKVAHGDDDPIDVIEVGGRSSPLKMGSITPCRIIGGLELIDQGEMDYKILCVAAATATATSNGVKSTIQSIEDLQLIRPGYFEKLVDWVINYKTTDGKSPNVLKSKIPLNVSQVLTILDQAHDSWRQLCGLNHDDSITITAGTTTAADAAARSKTPEEFWLRSRKCRGG